ncbi:MAG: exodeoxyribonuclease III [Chloroflexi bacterium]|nr:exodeoxyribonuclease III [Chloroflexota bacterium]
MANRWKLLSWNVNGLRAVVKKGFLQWFLQEDPDILCLQESKLSEDQVPEDLRQVPGYHLYVSSAQRKGYSGVMLYTKTEPQSVLYGFGGDEFDNEGRIIIADYGHLVLMNIYFPNGRTGQERLDYKMRFYEAFLEFVEGMKAQGRRIVVCGDVNTAHKEIDIARPRENAKTSGFLPMEREWMDRFVERGYVDTFRMFNQEPGQYTWWDTISRARERNVGWRIDYFFVDQGASEGVESAWIMPEVMGSDHCPIGLRLKLPG